MGIFSFLPFCTIKKTTYKNKNMEKANLEKYTIFYLLLYKQGFPDDVTFFSTFLIYCTYMYYRFERI